MATIKFLIDMAAPDAQKTFDAISTRLTRLDRDLTKTREIGVSDKDAAAKLARTQLAADRLGERLESMPLTIDGAKRAEVQLLTLEATASKLDKTLSGGGTRSAATGMEDLGGSAAALGGTLGKLSNFAIPALIGGVVAVSPVIATLGTGLGGLGLAALGVVKNAKLMQTVLAPAKAELAAFQKSLQPVVLEDFSAGLRIAGHLLQDVRPVAQATGKAVAVMLGAVDQEFQSGTWQRFFGWMAKEAGPDTQLLTQDVLQLVHALPSILTALQPIATGTLKTTGQVERLTGDIAKLTSNVATLNHVAPKDTTAKSSPLYWVTDDGIIHGLKYVNDILPRLLQHAAEGAGAVSKTGANAKAAGPEITSMAIAQAAAAKAAQQQAAKNWNVANSITAITNAESKALDTQLAYSNALITQKNDAQSLRTALKASGGAVGLHTAAQRASFTTANQFIGDLVNTAQKAWASGRGIDGQRKAIGNALPLLESVKTKSREYWQELRTLKQWYDRLSREEIIHERIKVTGTGNWQNMAPGAAAPGQPGMKRVPTNAAAGMLVHGGTPGRDSVLVNTMPGELIVPTKLVGAGLVDHLRGMIPGFAKGGIVPGYSGSVKGLVPWGQHNLDATISKITSSIAGSMERAFMKSLAGTGIGGMGDSGARTRSAAVAQAFARGLLSMYGWSAAQMGSLIPLWNQESGWNAYAVNASSGAYGIPQSLGHGHPFNLGDYKSQIIWGLNYIRQRYGSPAGAWAHERAFNWYASGTGGARKGWAWVGERGPELVKFGGGEHVLDAVTSMKVAAGSLAGYAKGTSLAKLGREMLRRHHTGVLDHEVSNTKARYNSEHLLATAPGLGRARHRHYAKLAAADHKRLKSLEHTLSAERAYRGQLQARVSVLKATAAAARKEHLGGEAAELERRIKRHNAIIHNINLWTEGKVAKASKTATTATAPAAPTGNLTISDWAAYLSALTPAFKTGSWYVPATGPATVHQGEMIFPKDVADSIRSGGLGGDINVYVDLDGQAIEPRMVRVADERIENRDRWHNRRRNSGSGRH